MTPAALSTAIAAALRYDCADDPAAARLQQTIREGGLALALRQVCGIEPDGELGKLVAAAYQELVR